jgi:formylglycine-generating enzyme required for sulfatase activity
LATLIDDRLGAVAEELRASGLRLPGRRARLSRAPVTNAQYAAILDAAALEGERRGGYVQLNVFNPDLALGVDAEGRCRVRPGYERHPVAGVSWTGAVLAAAAVGARLPTVAEWQWAASNGGRTAYAWGDGPPRPELANYAEHVGATTPVGSYPASRWGFLDLAGNVGEWCADAEHDAGPQETAETAETAETLRLRCRCAELPVLGGGWNKPEELLRADAVRHKWGRIGTVAIGFRLAFDD